MNGRTDNSFRESAMALVGAHHPKSNGYWKQVRLVTYPEEFPEKLLKRAQKKWPGALKPGEAPLVMIVTPGWGYSLASARPALFVSDQRVYGNLVEEPLALADVLTVHVEVEEQWTGATMFYPLLLINGGRVARAAVALQMQLPKAKKAFEDAAALVRSLAQAARGAASDSRAPVAPEPTALTAGEVPMPGAARVIASSVCSGASAEEATASGTGAGLSPQVARKMYEEMKAIYERPVPTGRYLTQLLGGVGLVLAGIATAVVCGVALGGRKSSMHYVGIFAAMGGIAVAAKGWRGLSARPKMRSEELYARWWAREQARRTGNTA